MGNFNHADTELLTWMNRYRKAMKIREQAYANYLANKTRLKDWCEAEKAKSASLNAHSIALLKIASVENVIDQVEKCVCEEKKTTKFLDKLTRALSGTYNLLQNPAEHAASYLEQADEAIGAPDLRIQSIGNALIQVAVITLAVSTISAVVLFPPLLLFSALSLGLLIAGCCLLHESSQRLGLSKAMDNVASTISPTVHAAKRQDQNPGHFSLFCSQQQSAVPTPAAIFYGPLADAIVNSRLI